jgi:hypothetical protein
VVRRTIKITLQSTGTGAWASAAPSSGDFIKLDAGGTAAWKFINADDAVELYDASGYPDRHRRSGRRLSFTSSGVQLNPSPATGDIHWGLPRRPKPPQPQRPPRPMRKPSPGYDTQGTDWRQ